MTIVVKGMPALAATLRSGFFRRAGVNLKVVSTALQLLREVRFGDADLVVMQGSAGPSAAARQLAFRLRRAVTAGRPHLVLALPAAGLPVAEELSLFDRVMPFVAVEEDVVRLLRPQLPRARAEVRQRGRVSVRLFARSLPTFRGEAIDLSRQGVGLVADCALGTTAPLSLLFHREDGRSALVRAKKAWSRESAPHRAGFLIAPEEETVEALLDLAAWEISAGQSGPVLRLHGALTAQSRLEGARRPAESVVALDLSEVAEVRPEGIRRFLDLVEPLARLRPLRLLRVPASIARAVEMRADLGNLIIESSEHEHRCAHCEIEFLDWRERHRESPRDCPLCAMPIPRAEQGRIYALPR